MRANLAAVRGRTRLQRTPLCSPIVAAATGRAANQAILLRSGPTEKYAANEKESLFVELIGVRQ
jgi:hypothetical protein